MADGGIETHDEPEKPEFVKKASSDTLNVGLMEEATVSVSVRLSGDLLEILKDIARLRHLSWPEALSHAITTDHFICQEIHRGSKILIEQADSKLYRVDL